MAMFNRQQAGLAGERAGSVYLERQGYRIVERNFRTPYGEIDLVARDGAALVFVEVKLRRSAVCGRPEAAVDRRKQGHIVRAALHYLKSRNLRPEEIRFDVLALGPAPDEIALIRRAFDAPPDYIY
jgi:putative endonuclease